MGLEGSGWAELRRVISQLNRASRDVLPDATRAGEAGVREQYHAGFIDQRDPWGNAWEPTKKGNVPVLVGPTGQLANAQITSRAGVVRLRPVKYWIFHQVGANGMPQRALVPFGHSRWDPPIQRRIRRVVDKYFSRVSI